jgi:hypothetical protein
MPLPDHDAVRIRDDRYLFSLRPWAYFSLWFVLSIGLAALLEAAPWWVRVPLLAPIGWSLPVYLARMPWAARRQRPGADQP